MIRSVALMACGALLFIGGEAAAQVVIPPPGPQIGSSNPVTADDFVPRPPTKPCIVSLFENVAFDDFNPRTFSFTPPVDCPGPWAKVVFTADFTVTAGRQFDRTANFFIDNVNIYYGTTAEPRSTLSPSWHVERDVTDLSAIFHSSQAGVANLGNFVGTYNGVVYNGIIYANAALEFYPAPFFLGAPRTPDVIVPLPDSSGPATLSTPTSQLTQAVTLPGNVESVFMDVIAQSQSNDEQWFLCVPNDVANELESCGDTGFRETEISIDGQPAGVAPVYPWIYTGGIDPYLWEPIPGLQTLNFKPYRVNLTPFAGVFADAKPHIVAIEVYNAVNYFLLDATLLAFTDHGSGQVSGAVTSNTLTPPQPAITEDLTTAPDGTISGTVTVTSNRQFSISGYVTTSHGRVETTVNQKIAFSNSQYFLINAAQYTQNLQQSTTVNAQTITRNGFLQTEDDKEISYPFTFDLTQNINADGSITEPNSSNQQYLETEEQRLQGIPVYRKSISDQVTSTDTDTIAIVNGGYALTGHTGQKSSQQYRVQDSLGACYSRTLNAANSVLTGYLDGQGCPGNH